MIGTIIRILIFGTVVVLVAYLIPSIGVASFVSALFAGIILVIINTFIRPILRVVFLPVNVITLGLFGLVLNGALLYGVASLVPGFSVETILGAILGALILSLASALLFK